ncbi:MFS transporter [Amycolatopsis sp. NPDC021455]|uniref:MFS transporter n=1 Tax=Amycolatopsis sp. NPDC021455 TaxID=3154901 RepID=UPI0033C63A90
MDTTAVQRKRPGLVGAILAATNFLAVFDGFVVVVALPAIQARFTLDALTAQWVITAYALPLGGLLLAGGRCGDRFGTHRTMRAGLWTFTAGAVLAGLAPTGWFLLGARALQGIGAALAVPSSFALISAQADPARRNKWFGVVAIAGGSGAAFGAVLGGLVTEGLGWRWVFWLSALIAAAAALGSDRVLPRDQPQHQSTRLGLVSAALSVTGLMALVFALTAIDRYGATAPVTLTSAAAALILLGLFAVREAHATTPLIHWPLLRLPALRASVAGMPGEEFAYQGTVYIGLLLLQQAFGLSPATAGLAFVPLGIAVLCGSPLATRLLNRLNWTTVASTTLIGCAAGLVLLSLTNSRDDLIPVFIPALVLLGLTTAVAAVALNAAAGKDVPLVHKGVAYGIHETSTNLSGALAVAGLSTIAQATAGHTTGTPTWQITHGYHVALLAAATASTIAAIAIPLLNRESTRAESSD